jgi:hypothetical protein
LLALLSHGAGCRAAAQRHPRRPPVVPPALPLAAFSPRVLPQFPTSSPTVAPPRATSGIARVLTDERRSEPVIEVIDDTVGAEAQEVSAPARCSGGAWGSEAYRARSPSGSLRPRGCMRRPSSLRGTSRLARRPRARAVGDGVAVYVVDGIDCGENKIMQLLASTCGGIRCVSIIGGDQYDIDGFTVHRRSIEVHF